MPYSRHHDGTVVGSDAVLCRRGADAVQTRCRRGADVLTSFGGLEQSHDLVVRHATLEDGR